MASTDFSSPVHRGAPRLPSMLVSDLGAGLRFSRWLDPEIKLEIPEEPEPEPEPEPELVEPRKEESWRELKKVPEVESEDSFVTADFEIGLKETVAPESSRGHTSRPSGESVQELGEDSDLESAPETAKEFDEPMPQVPARSSARAPVAPQHPISAMQEAFAESLIEVTNGEILRPKLRWGDAKTRRQELLDQDRSDGPPLPSWRYRSGQKCHELRKLVAQISFGVYLLLKGMANSSAQVVSILQGHIDEVDEYLEVAMEDFEETVTDLEDRLQHLKIPMDNMAVFEHMLEARDFRLQIAEGNVKIEHIVSRTQTALIQSSQDITEGLRSIKEFMGYLEEQQDGTWRRIKPDVIDIFDAMRGNAEGWYNAFLELQSKSNTVNGLLVKLNGIVADMNRIASEVSRRTRFSVKPFTSPVASVKSPARSSRTATSSSTSSMANRSSRLQFSKSTSNLRSRPPSPEYFDIPTLDTLPSIAYTPVEEKGKAKREAATAVPVHEEDAASGTESPADEEPLYILQPRTYTPVPPAPLPSPRVLGQQNESRSSSRPASEQPKKRTSIRQRVSLRTKPPESIEVPPPTIELQRPVFASPRTYQAYKTFQGPDSPSGSDVNRGAIRSITEPNIPTISRPELSPPVFPGVIPSPHSEQQYFRPVQASPHSPLQQRPHTAGNVRPMTAYHQRNAPSNMGMSMLSNISTSNVSTLHPGSVAGTTARNLKKKRSAFGWLKKAFSLDDEERAAFEQRKHEATKNPYYDPRSTKFLDGKRLR